MGHAGASSLGSRLALRFASSTALAVGLTLAVFAVLASNSFRSLSSAYEASAEESLLEAIEDHGAAAAQYLAYSVADPLYNDALNRVEDVVGAVAGLPGIVDVIVYDRNGMLLFDGSGGLGRFGEMAPGLLIDAPKGTANSRWRDGVLRHFAQRICIADECFGWAVVSIEIGKVKSEAAKITSRLAKERQQEFDRLALFGVGLFIVMVIGSGLFGVIVSAPFARSLGSAVAAIGDIARGGAGKARDQIADPAFGELAHAVEKLSEDLEATDKSRSAILAAMTDGVVAMTRNGQISLQNPAFMKMFGAHSVLSAKQLFVLPAHLSGAALVEALRGVEVVRLPATGALIDVMVSAAFIGGAGEERGIVAVVRDVSERARRERELEEAMRRAALGERVKDEFLSVMSHEIRTPLNGVLGMLSLMQSSGLSEKQAKQADVALRSGRELLSLLNDILDVSKLEAGRLELIEESVALQPLIDDVVSLCRAQGALKGVEVRALPSRGTPAAVRTDAMRLRQILMNLVGNAVKFTERGSVTIRSFWTEGEDEGLLRIEVRDTGVGVPKDARAAIFDRFQQVDGSNTRRFGGTGLGLSISTQIIRLMRGEIGVEDNPGGGAVFWIEAPVERAELVETADAAPVEAAPAARALRVLVAEDNDVNQMVIDAMLKQAGHDPLVVGDGAQAVEAVRRETFDLVLMDVRMPVMDGIAATEAIRSGTQRGASIPIIALTANAMAGDAERFLAAGMNDYIAKPISPQALQDALLRVAHGLVRREGASVALKAG